MMFATPPDSPVFYAFAALCLLLAVVLVWQAVRYYQGRRRVWRLLAGLLAAAALWCSVYPPERALTLPAAGHTAILLTPGYRPDSLRSLRLRLGEVPLLRYQPVQSAGDTAGVSSLLELSEAHPDIHTVHVLGQGLPSADVVGSGLRLIPHPMTLVDGFTAGQWNQQLVLGSALRVQGHFASTGKKPTWVHLFAAGARRDSVRLPAGSGSFMLQYRPRTTGRILAHLQAHRGTELVAAEPVPTQVQPTRPLRLLLLSNTPSFELNLLKNRLAELGHQVAVRLSISRGMQQTEFINRPSTGLDRLTPRQLTGFDAVIGDAESLGSLSAAEGQALAGAVREGLGLVVLASAPSLPRWLPGRSELAVKAQLLQSATARPRLLSWNGGTGSALLPATLSPHLHLRPLVRVTRAAYLAAGARRAGWGTVVVATPTETYRWLLSGQTATYEGFWSELLTAAARPVELSAQWAIEPWASPHRPVTVQVTTQQRAEEALRISAAAGRPATVPLRQSAQLPGSFRGTYWPAQPGWHRAVLPRADSTWFYVYPTHAWLGPRRVTGLADAEQLTAVKRAAPITRPHQQPWARGWFVALFVAAAGALWLDEKRRP